MFYIVMRRLDHAPQIIKKSRFKTKLKKELINLLKQIENRGDLYFYLTSDKEIRKAGSL